MSGGAKRWHLLRAAIVDGDVASRGVLLRICSLHLQHGACVLLPADPEAAELTELCIVDE